jgi:hypothetical protein
MQVYVRLYVCACAFMFPINILLSAKIFSSTPVKTIICHLWSHLFSTKVVQHNCNFRLYSLKTGENAKTNSSQFTLRWIFALEYLAFSSIRRCCCTCIIFLAWHKILIRGLLSLTVNVSTSLHYGFFFSVACMFMVSQLGFFLILVMLISSAVCLWWESRASLDFLCHVMSSTEL